MCNAYTLQLQQKLRNSRFRASPRRRKRRNEENGNLELQAENAETKKMATEDAEPKNRRKWRWKSFSELLRE